jgi:SAM-dependent methyltransferase
MKERMARDKHFPAFAHDNPFRRLFFPPRRLVGPHIGPGQTAADLGCGPGYHTITLADLVGPMGKIYAVDSDERAIEILRKKADAHGCTNIDMRAQSACDLSFIADATLDFVLAHGLLCSMAPKDHDCAVNEIRRILKPAGLAYLSAAKGFISYISRTEWVGILRGFEVVLRGKGFPVFENRWALVRKLTSAGNSVK